MAANYNESRPFNTTVPVMSALIKDLAFGQAMNLKLEAENANGTSVWYQFSHGVSMTSWGEKVTVMLTPIAADRLRVDIYSECCMPTQIIDWGKNKKNVNKILQYITSYLPHYQTTCPATPAEPTAPVAQKQCFNCGAALAANANFCMKCGTKQA